MTIEDFAKLVKEMRDAQVIFFKTGHFDYLTKSKKLEREVDKATEEIIEGSPKQAGLFPQPPRHGG